MTYMSEYSKQIFSDPLSLRTKLALYLGTPHKVELYARACEGFFYKSGGVGLGFSLSWSWWAFFMTFWWALYRKQYLFALVAFALGFVPIANIFVMIGCALLAKYAVCKSFVGALNMQNDALLIINGGRNVWVIWLIIFFFIITAASMTLLFWLIPFVDIIKGFENSLDWEFMTSDTETISI